MLLMERVNHCYISGVKFTNSPYYHMLLFDVNDFLIENLEIRDNVVEQKKLAMQYGEFDMKLGIPTFPLNTDGINPSESNIVIRNVNITSYNDSIAVKPANKGNKIAKCAENILAENLITYMGVGMTIGSVPPNDNYACIRNVTFRNIVQHFPLKAIYVKTNPGTHGSGCIENILYENFTDERSYPCKLCLQEEAITW